MGVISSQIGRMTPFGMRPVLTGDDVTLRLICLKPQDFSFSVNFISERKNLSQV